MSGSKLIIEATLMADLRSHLAGGGIESAIAAQAFLTLVWGEDNSGLGPLYEGAARTVWHVEGLESAMAPPIEVRVFDWGGDHLGVEALRIWYLMGKDDSNLGFGAFPASPAPPYDEEAEVFARLRAMLGPACRFVEP